MSHFAAVEAMKHSVDGAMVYMYHSVEGVTMYMYHSVIVDHSDGPVIDYQPVGAANCAGAAAAMGHSVEVGDVIMGHSVVFSVGTVAVNHSVYGGTTDHFLLLVDSFAVLPVVSHFAVAKSEHSEVLSVAAAPIKDHSVVALAMVDHSSVAVVTGHSWWD